jgi:heterodisulfide reductase subunit C
MESEHPLTFADQVRSIPGGELLERCYACGTCVSRCLIQQKLEPEYNPRRLLYMVIMGMREEAFESLTTWLCSACDLCYPACPQEIHISGVINAVKELTVEASYSSPLHTAQVNTKTCVACGLCVEVCPYDAIKLVEKNIPNRGKNITVAEVDSAHCMACGLCSSVCRSTSIGLTEEYCDLLVVESLSGWLVEKAAEESA